MLELPTDSNPVVQEHAVCLYVSTNLVLAYAESVQISWHCQSHFLTHALSKGLLVLKAFGLFVGEELLL